ncbi:MAG: CARDB domain-containing protein, partial [Bacteroidota bacterium]
MRVVLLLSIFSFLSLTHIGANELDKLHNGMNNETYSNFSNPDLGCFELGELDVNGSIITITNFKIRNNGFSPSSVSYVGYYLSKDKNFTTDDIFLGHDYVEGLSEREISTEDFMVNLNDLNVTISNGEYYVGTIIDYMNSVEEGNGEANNNSCHWDNPKVVVGGKPNLACKGLGELTIDGLDIKIGWVKVENKGTAPAGASKVGFYLSENQNITTSDHFLGSVDVPPLDVDEFVMIPKFEIDLGTLDLAAGNYFIGYFIDFDNAVHESNENDNNDCSYDEIITIGEIPSGEPNLACRERGTLTIDGDRATVKGTKIQNYGDAKSKAGQLGYYLSENTTFTTNDLLIKTRSLNALEPGEMQSFGEVVIDLSIYNLDPGTYFIGVIVDDTNETEESNEGDNNTCFWDHPTYEVENGKPNLACKDRGELIIDNHTGEVYIGWTSVINLGDTGAGPSQIGFYVSTDSEFSDDDVLLGTRNIGSLAPGESEMIQELETNYNPLNLAPGTYFVLVVIDHNEEVTESNEHDNDDCFWDEPKIFIPNNKADLACKTLGELIIDNHDLSYYIGWTTVINNGPGKAGASRIGFYVSTDKVLSDDDVLFASQAIGMLEPGESQMIHPIEDVLDLDLPAGNYHVLVDIDYLDEVAETDEHNNDDCFWEEPRFHIPEENREPNLTCKERGFLTVNGENISISGLKITNNGNESAGSSTVGIYLSTNQFFSNTDILVGTVHIPALSPGEVKTVNFNKDLGTLHIAAGEYFVGIIVDKDKQVEESDETDNAGCFWVSPKVKITAAKPNLACKSRGELVITGTTQLKFSWIKIENKGDAKADPSKVGFYLSTDSHITTSDIFLGFVSVGTIHAGETISLGAFTKNISGLNLADGTYHAGFIVDYTDQVDESNEHDNNDCSYDNKLIIDNSKADLKCANLGVITVNGTQVKISSFKVRNAGNKRSPASKVGFYLSTDTYFSTDDYFIGARNIDPLHPGQEDLISSLDVDVSNFNIPPGTYHVGTVIDYTYLVHESNESNNNDCFYSKKVTIPQPKPNLTCHDRGELSINGHEIHISWVKIKNTGHGASAATKVGYYLSTDTHFTTSDISLGSVSLGKLVPGEVKLLSAFNKNISSLHLAPGKYFVGIIIDPHQTVAETNEHDNNDCFWTHPQLHIQPPKPNLACASRGEISANGSTINISWLRVKNNGGSTAGASHVGYYLSTDTHFTTSDIRIGSRYLSAITAGATKTVDPITINLSSLHLPVGEYFIGTIIDYKDEVHESNESDNNDCFFTSPKVIVHPPKPNLTCFSKGELSVTGTEIHYSWGRIKNDGGSTAGAHHVGYYLSTDQHFTTGDFLVGETYVSSLAAGAIKTLPSFNVDASDKHIPSGNYYFGIIIDYKYQVTESDEHDNNDCFFVHPRVHIPAAKPDLKCKDLGEISINGDKINISWSKVMNRGDGPSIPTRVGYYLSMNTTIKPSEDIFIGSRHIPAISAGSHITVDPINIDVSHLSIPPGTYYVGQFIDDQYKVAEEIEANNTCFFSSPRYQKQAAKPNLTLKYGSGGLSINGSTLHFSDIKVINDGGSNAEASKLGYYLSTNDKIRPSEDILIGEDHVAALSPNQVSTESASINLTGMNIPAGTYYIGFFIDYKYDVHESNEHDNGFRFTHRITVNAPNHKPDLSCLYAGELTVIGEERVRIQGLQVRNIGQKHAPASTIGFYLSTDKHFDENDYFVGSKDVNALNPGKTATLTFEE